MNTADLSLWYELSLNYYNRAIKYGTNETRKKHLDLAAEAAKHIIKEAPHRWKYWNLLGVICTTNGKNRTLIQTIFGSLFLTMSFVVFYSLPSLRYE